MNIIDAFDRGTISNIEPRKNSVLISITSNQHSHPKVSNDWCKILRLKFDDVDGRVTEIGDSTNVLTEKQAKEILDFVVENIDKDFFVNCDAGISRSTAIVVALELIFNGRDFSDKYPYHNKFVKNRIKDVWFKTIWNKKDERID